MEQITYAYVRKDLKEEGFCPSCSHQIDFDLWCCLGFQVVDFIEDEEDFNMVILHPLTSELMEVYSIDFEYVY